MTGKKKELPVFEKVEILSAGSEGKAIAKVDNMVMPVIMSVILFVVTRKIGNR